MFYFTLETCDIPTTINSVNSICLKNHLTFKERGS